MSFQVFLERCLIEGVSFSLEEEGLCIDSDGDISDDLIDDIRSRKNNIVDWLKARKNDSKKLELEKAKIPFEDRPLSYAQQRLWFLDQMDGGSHYNVSSAFKVSGYFSIAAAEIAVNTVISRHESLRTNFGKKEDGSARLLLNKTPSFSISVLDAKKLSDTKKSVYVQEQVKEEAKIRFDLSSDLMIRARWIELENEQGVLLFTMHHIASDGWSIDLFVKEFVTGYEECIQAEEQDISDSVAPSLDIQYSDFACWQAESIKQGVYESQLEYWRGSLQGIPLQHSLPLDHSRPDEQTFNGASHKLLLNNELKESIISIAKKTDNTLFIVLHALFSLHIHRYSNVDTLVVGTPVANRIHEQLEPLIGFFVNSLALKTSLEGAPSFLEYLRSVRNVNLLAQENQSVPFECIVDDLNPERSVQYSPLFQIMFAMNTNVEPVLALEGIRFEALTPEGYVAKYDLTLNATLQEEGIDLGFVYNTDLFNDDSIKSLTDSFAYFVEKVITSPNENIQNLPLFETTPGDAVGLQGEVIVNAKFSKQRLDTIFEEQVQLIPEKTALIYQDDSLNGKKNKSISYLELNQKANGLAKVVRNTFSTCFKVTQLTDTPVALYLDKGANSIISILGVLKSGAAYLPLSLDYPVERLNFILNDANIRVIVTEASCYKKLKNYLEFVNSNVKIIIVDECGAEENNVIDDTRSVSDLAYIIYTSGTTGKPKGVMVEHRNVTNLVVGQVKAFNFGRDEKVLWLASYVFDASVETLFLTLCSGSTLVIPTSENIHSIVAIQQLISEEKISHLHSTPSYLTMLGDQVVTPSLRRIISGGEACSAGVARLWGDKLINEYGPTETTVTSIQDIEYSTKGNFLCIGSPVANTQAYVLSNELQLLPIGVVGELYIGGEGVTRGYLNRNELTEERFISSPFSSGKLYKTGDLVKQNASGKLEFFGRKDNQVKINGYRIELGEIENNLLALPSVKQAVVVVHDVSHGKRLVAYVVSHIGTTLDENSILAMLAEKIPQYMVPAACVFVEFIPLTVNGKVNYGALPGIVLDNKDAYVAPKNEIQETLSSLWATILDIEKVGIQTDFFSLGGNSIAAIKLVSQINIAFQSQLSVKDIFKHKTISKIEPLIIASKGDFQYRNFQINDGDTEKYTPYALTNVQQAYLFGRMGNFELGNVSTHGYSETIFSNIDVKKFQQCFNLLIQRHPALRTVFSDKDQRVLREVPEYVVVDHGEVSKNRFNEIRNRLSHKVYDVSQSPLMDFEVSRYDSECILHMSIDALIMDGQSSGIFFSELVKLYSSVLPKEVFLPELDATFKQYMTQYERLRQGDIYQRSKDYWLEKLPGYDFSARLPMQKNPANIQTPKFSRLKTIVPLDVWSKIEALTLENNISLTSLVLYVYGVVLSRWSGKRSFCINLTLFNRLPLHTQVNGILGDFTVLELFNFTRTRDLPITESMNLIHSRLWDDIEHNLFDGIDFQRLARKELSISSDQALSPVVLTSVLGEKNNNDLGIPEFVKKGYSITQTSQVYLDNKAYVSDEGFVAEWDYVEQIFEPELIQAMHNEYCLLLESLAKTSWDQPLRLIKTDERSLAVIKQANSNITPMVSDTLVSLSLEGMTRHADRIGVVDVYGEHTHQKLKEYSVRIANCLYQGRSLTNTLIGVLSEKGHQQVVSTLAIMQAGGAYLPLHADWPLDRIDEVLTEGLVSQVLVSEALFEQRIQNSKLIDKYLWLVVESAYSDERISSEDTALPSVGLDDIAYVIFTSGSTGKPKGVTISHRGAVNTIVAVNEKCDVSEKDTVFALSELSFDLSVYDIFGFLAKGGSIVFPDPDKTKDPEHWLSCVNRYHVSLWNTVPQLMQLLVDQAEGAGDSGLGISSIKQVLMSGDWIPLSLPTQIRKQSQDSNVISLGGATEGSIWSIWYPVNTVDSSWRSIPYGTAMPNQNMYVLNEFGEHSPIDVTGEVHIGGVGVALNYWRDEEKTQASYFTHPTLGRLYRTGDLGRWNIEGYIEFEGRKDNQVKLNGYRVELDEISAKITQIEGIEQALVRVQDNQVVAYLVCEKRIGKTDEATFENQIDIVKIEQYIRDKLPEYMHPKHYISLENLPLTANGKLDDSKLPKVKTDDHLYVPPASDVEKVLCAIWREILDLDKVSIEENFFRLGGDSILAIGLVGQAKNAGFDLSVADVFSCQTIKSLSELVETTVVGDAGVGELDYDAFSLIDEQQKDEIVNSLNYEVEDIYPAASLQVGMLLESAVTPGIYHDISTQRINVSFDLEHLNTIFEKLCSIHESLRMAFLPDDEHSFVVVVAKYIEKNVEVISSHITEQEIIESEHGVGFEFSKPGLFRCLVSAIEDNAFTLTLSFHHAIRDGWSVYNFMYQLIGAYFNKFDLDSVQDYPAYGEYIRNEQSAMLNQDLNCFWQDYYSGYTFPKYPILGSKLSDIQGVTKSKCLSDTTSENVISLARDLNVSVDVVFLAAFHRALCLLQDTSSSMIGIISNNRIEKSGGENALGLFLNLLPCHIDTEDCTDNASLIRSVAREKTDILAHRSLPFSSITKVSNFQGESYEAVFNYIHFGVEKSKNGIVSDGMSNNTVAKMIEVREGFESTDVPLALNVSRSGNSFTLNLDAHIGRVEHFRQDQLLEYVELCLEGLLTNSQNTSSKIVAASEISKITQWEGMVSNDSITLSISREFEKQVDASPAKIALSTHLESLTYQNLNSRANKLARRIIENIGTCENGGLSERLVALYFDKSIDMVIAILATLKSGAAYVPLSPGYPTERGAYILENSRASLIVVEPKYISDVNNIPQNRASGCPIISYHYQEEDYSDDSNLEYTPDARSLAYIIYTSGTTGVPKGVEIEHASVMNLIQSKTRKYDFDTTEKSIWLASYVFDASVEVLFLTLLNGAELILPMEEDIKDADVIKRKIVEGSVTHLNATPAYLSALGPLDSESSIRRVISGGEQCHKTLVEWWGDKLINAYGPTEATITATEGYVTDSDNFLVSIGKPLENVQCFILSDDRERLPIGTVGELYIGGKGLARGYRGGDMDPSAFIDVGQSDEGLPERLYKTGDLARWLSDGSIQYIGRNDSQVKIRGFRIELGEIETRLALHSDIEKVVVIDFKVDEINRLCAYFIPKSTQPEISEDSLKGCLKESLPDYMVPSSFIKVDEFPLTVNGKIDRVKLPEPQFESVNRYVAPTSEHERSLCQMWQETLRIDCVGVCDNFFEVGGDSLTMMKIISKMKNMDMHISVKNFYKYPKISEQIQKVDENQKNYSFSIQDKEIPLIPNRYELKDFIPEGEDPSVINHWNALRLYKFKKDRFDLDIAKKAWNYLIHHHDGLLSRIDISGFEWREKVVIRREAVTIDFVECNTSEPCYRRELAKCIKNLQKKIRLDSNPVDLSVVDVGDDEYAYLIMTIHHVLIDALSLQVFLGDFLSVYTALQEGKPIELPARTLSLTEYANKQYEFSQSEEVLDDFSYMKNLDWTGSKQLLTDFPIERESNFAYQNTNIEFFLNENDTRSVLDAVKETPEINSRSLIVSALVKTLSAWTNSENVHLYMQYHGRKQRQLDVDLSRTVGHFSEMYNIPFSIDSSISPRSQHQDIGRQFSERSCRLESFGMLKYMCQRREVKEYMQGFSIPQVALNIVDDAEANHPDGNPKDMLMHQVEYPELELFRLWRSERLDHRNIFYIMAHVEFGRYKYIVTYSKALFKKSTVMRFGEDLISNLKNVVNN